MADVPSVDEYRNRFAKDIAAKKAEEQRRNDEAAQAKQRHNDACNKRILDTIAKDTQSFGKAFWRFDSTNCNVEPSIAILEQKGYTIGCDSPYRMGDPMSGSRRLTQCESFTVKLNKY